MKTLFRLLSQKLSDLGLHFLSWLFWQATSVRNFRMPTVCLGILFVFVVFLIQSYCIVMILLFFPAKPKPMCDVSV